jgi:branched-chain amino acid transport system substrate-binding protein
MIYQNDDFGKDELNGLKNGLDPEKNELVSEQSYEITAVSVRSQVSNVKDAGAEVLVSACIPPTCAQIIKEADRLGWDPQIFINYTNSDPMMFLYSSPELMEGIITLQGNKLSTWTDDPAVAEHHRIMAEYSDFPPGNFTIVGSAAAALTVEVLGRTCDNLTRQGVMDAVHSIKDYQGDLTLPGITQTLSPTDHYATEAMRMLRAHDGEWEYFGDIISFRD